MGILSIQSHVAYGHVGNAAAAFALQRLGLEVWPVMTVQLSNHTGYAAWRGRSFEAEHIADVVQGLEDVGALAACRAVLSGYLRSAAVGEAVLGAVERARRRNPEAFYVCDPVLGDHGRGLYVPDEVAAFFRDRAVPRARIVTPNLFELAELTGRPIERAGRGPGDLRALSRERARQRRPPGGHRGRGMAGRHALAGHEPARQRSRRHGGGPLSRPLLAGREGA